MLEDKEVIQDRMIKNVSNIYDRSEGSFFYDALKPVAIELEYMKKDMKNLEDKLEIKNLKETELEQRVYEKTGIKRKLATQATGYVTIIGKKGAKICINDKVSSDTVDFIVQEDKTIDDKGQVEVWVKCEVYGIIGNVPAEAIRYFPVTLNGIKKVINPKEFTNGYDAESDEELLQRYYERIRTPATSGNKYHYLNWAKEVTGVGDARVIPLPNNQPNTVKVVVIDKEKKPNIELAKEVQEYIDPGSKGLGEGKAPIGAFCKVVSAEPVLLNISFHLTEKDTAILQEVIQKDVEENIKLYLKEIAFRENKVSYNKIASIVLDSKGILDFSDLTINNEKKNIMIHEEAVPVLGGVIIA
ncbi:baseplate J/gp47 family protein [Inediibacterium massiliense]|uniref:baseplate J/gp47 family protein n=1 Tax=Inediibacterium massiliense TaxID=1658111 RepID=UPI0006B45E50|nr:baseplate J/gp47 family protein [Inediibacterium massiliense]